MSSVTSHRQLVAWQLCEELSEAVCALLANGPGARDFNLCDQLHRSADAPAPLIAEGFGRRTPREFAHYLRMADSSLRESTDWIERGIKRQYWAPGAGEAALNLCWRALDMTSKLLASKERQIAARARNKRNRSLR